MLKTGEYFWKDGWYFSRSEGGTVVIEQRTSAGGVTARLAIPAAEWASIISHVSAGGEGAQYQAAVAFHAATHAP